MRRPGRLLLAPLVFLIAGAVFLPALRGEFLNWDDSVNFVANPHYRGLGWAQIKWMLERNPHGPLHPGDVAELRTELHPRRHGPLGLSPR